MFYGNDTDIILDELGDEVRLLYPNNSLADNITYVNGQQFGSTVYNSSLGSSVGRYPDGAGDFMVFNATTPGESNAGGLNSVNILLYGGWNLISLPFTS